MTRVQTFLVKVETKDKDGCGEIVPAFSAGDIRSALARGLPRYESISVEEQGEPEKGGGRNF